MEVIRSGIDRLERLYTVCADGSVSLGGDEGGKPDLDDETWEKIDRFLARRGITRQSSNDKK